MCLLNVFIVLIVIDVIIVLWLDEDDGPFLHRWQGRYKPMFVNSFGMWWSHIWPLIQQWWWRYITPRAFICCVRCLSRALHGTNTQICGQDSTGEPACGQGSTGELAWRDHGQWNCCHVPLRVGFDHQLLRCSTAGGHGCARWLQHCGTLLFPSLSGGCCHR